MRKTIFLNSSKGFSLIGMLMALAGSSVLIFTMMSLAQLSTQIKALSEESVSFQSTVFVAQRTLSDPQTCKLNLENLVVTSERTPVLNALRTRNGAVLGGNIFPEGSGPGSIASQFIAKINGVSDVVMFNFEFRRSKIFGDSSAIRSFPLAVKYGLNNQITECSSSSSGEMNSGGSSPTPGGTLSRLKSGACDESKRPKLSRGSNEPDPISLRDLPNSTQMKAFCSKLSYPVPNGGPEVTCSMLQEFKIGGFARNPVVNLLDRYLGMIREDSNYRGPLFEDCFIASGPDKTFKVTQLAGIQSADECEQIPTSFSGMSLSRGVGAVDADQHQIDDGNTILCVDGNWVDIN